MSQTNSLLPRQVADAYVDDLIALDPITGTYLGVKESSSKLPDTSPEGQEALAELARTTLARLDEAERLPGADSDVERRCARLLRERLTAELAVHEADEGLRVVSNIHSPVHSVREVFTVTPADTEEDWAAIVERLRAVPDALRGYRESLALGLERKLYGGPRPTATFIEQLTEWADTGKGHGWFEDFASAGPETLRADLDEAARTATAAVADLRDWMRDVYAPAVEGAPDTVGRERYARFARYFNGTDLDLDEAYAYGWSEFHRILGEMKQEAEKILPGAETPWVALKHLDEHGAHIEGVDEVRTWLQGLMDEAMDALDGTHFDLAERVRKVEAHIAPPGGAAAPYYTPPSADFSRPGRTWLPTMGETRFPVYDLVSTWYHEGVPGHHLQLAQWVHVADSLSRYQATVGMVSANAEGWALYAERLMDELGFLTDPERRLGYLDAQMMRAARVIVDIGMHLELEIPEHSPFHPGERWTPALAQEFFGRHSSRPRDFVESELVRYLSMPGQAIGYKLGERAWLTGRENARKRHGDAFDAKAWHMAALSLGSLGLDDLVDELSQL
ncbi:DUF885 domain-containing protein [Streptomyces thermoviolaceus]|uniref:DUF885 domain-containing protein n=1 Tax=Streptomyces thermoviolaceus subsp. thermoviolaceus TaxID=66860 RepID=A0ABX0YQC4_STRTL|nr:DUF885 domain-containing protein [Streptomyces thermoviolaceus]MCM3262787.1 DUF885 domain-containing protein [Streptomyces thermoviolaceus]NJP14786.1 DUF885 domain-containing protein [Streptomyces thermoviolaceus subsp. thermoviolaceus]WTD50162.1 DUF885 domain-containing protein [Streptomyces thermoviolaceus]GGV64825.1 hypothetical protein GCM10010499_08840 [Streptomyces thermoviolaceus subsp. apingens]GHB00019.1 hypothetical protein GCM10010512_34350 [Streptomyces thermoviolaceus subsp. th